MIYYSQLNFPLQNFTKEPPKVKFCMAKKYYELPRFPKFFGQLTGSGWDKRNRGISVSSLNQESIWDAFQGLKCFHLLSLKGMSVIPLNNGWYVLKSLNQSDTQQTVTSLFILFWCIFSHRHCTINTYNSVYMYEDLGLCVKVCRCIRWTYTVTQLPINRI